MSRCPVLRFGIGLIMFVPVDMAALATFLTVHTELLAPDQVAVILRQVAVLQVAARSRSRISGWFFRNSPVGRESSPEVFRGVLRHRPYWREWRSCCSGRMSIRHLKSLQHILLWSSAIHPRRKASAIFCPLPGTGIAPPIPL